jgi:hypothetical protein
MRRNRVSAGKSLSAGNVGAGVNRCRLIYGIRPLRRPDQPTPYHSGPPGCGHPARHLNGGVENTDRTGKCSTCRPSGRMPIPALHRSRRTGARSAGCLGRDRKTRCPPGRVVATTDWSSVRAQARQPVGDLPNRSLPTRRLVRGTILAPLRFAQDLIRIALGKVHLPGASHKHKGSSCSRRSPERQYSCPQALIRQPITNRLVGR